MDTMDDKFYETDFLLPKNNFLIGMGSTMNLAGNYFKYNYSKSVIEADSKAIRSDWQNVGKDIKSALRKFKEKFNKNRKNV